MTQHVLTVTGGEDYAGPPDVYGPFDTIPEAQAFARAYRERFDIPGHENVEPTAEENEAWTEAGWEFAIVPLAPEMPPTPPRGDHEYTVTVHGCTQAQADQVMAERLEHDEDYGFPYRVTWSSVTDDHSALPASMSAQRAQDVALSISTVSSAHFTKRDDGMSDMSGVVHDASTGIEFDVRLSGDVWYVNDDEGRTYEHTVLERAILRAIEANRGGSPT